MLLPKSRLHLPVSSFRSCCLDVVFSLDSVITAVGMVEHIEIMVIAVILAAGVMIFVAGPLGNFVERHPTIKILALKFPLLNRFHSSCRGLAQPYSEGVYLLRHGLFHHG